MSILPLFHSAASDGTFILGKVAKKTFQITQTTALAVSGVALMCLGGAGIAFTLDRGYHFYKGDQGLKSFPGFEQTCYYSCGMLDSFLGTTPEASSTQNTAFAKAENSTEAPENKPIENLCHQFCESLLNHSFSNQSGIFKPAALIATFGSGVLTLLGSTYAFLGGLTLVGKSFEVFISAL